jgi:hypothetical protein
MQGDEKRRVERTEQAMVVAMRAGRLPPSKEKQTD